MGPVGSSRRTEAKSPPGGQNRLLAPVNDHCFEQQPDTARPPTGTQEGRVPTGVRATGQPWPFPEEGEGGGTGTTGGRRGGGAGAARTPGSRTSGTVWAHGGVGGPSLSRSSEPGFGRSDVSRRRPLRPERSSCGKVRARIAGAPSPPEAEGAPRGGRGGHGCARRGAAAGAAAGVREAG